MVTLPPGVVRMIDEPIIFSSYELRRDYIVQAKIGTVIFSITDNIWVCGNIVQFVRVTRKSQEVPTARWQCGCGVYQIFEPDIYGKRLKSGEFFEYIKVNYPDHFEWFLFHPEWL